MARPELSAGCCRIRTLGPGSSSPCGTPPETRAVRSSPERSLAALTVPVAAVLAALLTLAAPDNERLWDALNRALPAPPDPRVLVVGIDEASLRDYGRIGSWPRDLYSQA